MPGQAVGAAALCTCGVEAGGRRGTFIGAQKGAALRTGELLELSVAALQILRAGMENRFIQSMQAVESQAPPRVAIPN